MKQDKVINSSIDADEEALVLATEGLASFAVQLYGTFTGTLQFEGTVNGTDWVALPVKVPSTGAEVTSATAAGLWTGSCAGLLSVRVRASEWTDGTANVSLRAALAGGGSSNSTTVSDVEIGAVEIKNASSDDRAKVSTAGADAVSNTQNQLEIGSRLSGFNGTTWDRIRTAITTVSSTFTGFLTVLPWGIYHATPTTRTEGQGGPIETDNLGNARTREQYAPNYEDNDAGVAKVEQRATYANITADTAVKTGAGRWFGFILNSHTSGTLKVWDSTAASGTVICNTITFAAGPQQWVFPVGISFATGLFFDVGGTIDITPLYQ